MEAMNVAGDSAPPTPGALEASYPPDVVEVVRSLCKGLIPSEKLFMDVAEMYLKSAAKWKELGKRLEGKPPGTRLITDAQFAEKAKNSRHKDAEWFPKQYKFDNNIKEERTCIWRQGSGLWTEKSSGIIWVAVHGADTICVVTKKGGYLDHGRLGASCFKLIPEELVRAFFRKFIICEIEDLVDPPTERRQSIKKPSGVDLVDPLSTALRQSLQESIKKPFGVVSADNGSGKKDSSAVCYEEKAIKFLTEKMNRDTYFNVDETIKTAVGAFQCLFPEKMKATEIEVSVMDPMYRTDNPRYKVGRVDSETTDVTVWEVHPEVYEEYVDDFAKSGPGVNEEPFPNKKPRMTPLETQCVPPTSSSVMLLGYNA